MSSHRIVALPGDGIGAEVLQQARRLLDAIAKRSSLQFDVEEIPCGGRYWLERGHREGRDWPIGSEEKCRSADVILLGAVGWPSPDGKGPVTMPDGKMAGHSAVLGNRNRLDLYANVRPIKLYPGVRHGLSGTFRQAWEPGKIDILFVRENTEGLYAGAGGTLAPGGVKTVAVDTRIITRAASERVIKLAFEKARQRNGAPGDGKRRVTAIVKNNVLEGCRLFHDVFVELGAAYPDIEKDVAIVDAFAMWLMLRPEFYDVCVTTNLFGDILTDLGSVLQGGMGMAVGCNVGDHHGMFEPIHGSAPPLAGKDKANPLAMLLATGEALRWLGAKKSDAELSAWGDRVEAAVKVVVANGAPLTFDLVGEASAATMSEVTTAVLAQL
ncbi:MAG: isocitrate/isopropylmalate dehydrogenase family protein [Deltaproteobacteria bacterium]|nr:isocitrate/isopropylmalate dehydrogenase family protein [Deltaproteobacteria bacterium]